MGELPRQRAQITGVFVQTSEQRGETPRHISELIRRGGLREGGNQPLARQGGFASAAQPGKPQGQASGEYEHENDRDNRRNQRNVQHSRQCAVAQRQPAVAGLRDAQDPDPRLVLAVVYICRGLDRAACAGIIDEAAIEPRQDAGRRTELRGLRQRIGLRQQAPVRSRHRQAQARLQELHQIGRQIG